VEFADADDFEDTAAGSRTGMGAGAGAIVSAALGLVSLSGTSLSDQMQARKQLMGQIQSQMGGGGGDQIQAMYGGPWHMTALFNGMFALVAVIVGGALVAALGSRGRTGGWARPVALGGLILGVIGLLVSGGMFFDLFAPAPKIPGQ
jgi:mevalonate kinase